MTFRKSFLLAFAASLGLLASTAALAWTGPTATPPGSNATAPLNTSGTGQVKAGGLQLNTGGAAVGLLVGGKVGIGSMAPSGQLTVYGLGQTTPSVSPSGNLGGTLALVDSGGAPGNGGTILFGTTNGTINYGAGIKAVVTGSAVGNIVSSSDLAFLTGVSGNSTLSERMRITSSGAVVIGGTTPYNGGSTLTLESRNPDYWTEIANYNNGSPSGKYGIYAYGSVYALYGNGPVYGTAFYYLSDERAKKNIEAIASSTALQKILALEPVTYNWKDADKATTTQIGFIAQQVKKVVPELVLTDASTTQESVDYARVTPLLVGAAQAQQDRIDAMQKEIDALTAEVRALKAGK